MLVFISRAELEMGHDSVVISLDIYHILGLYSLESSNLPTVSLYTLTLREVIHREALIYTMPTVAAGGGHILKFKH